MGAWEQLDVSIEVEMDTSELEEMISEIGGGDFKDIFEPAINKAKAYKTALEKGGQQLADDLSHSVKSYQEELLDPSRHSHPYAKGNLFKSIERDEVTPYHYLIGTNITHFYPLCEEFGRGPVYPKTKPYLVFQIDGQWIRTKKVRASTPHPYARPSFEKTDQWATQRGLAMVTKWTDKVEKEGY